MKWNCDSEVKYSPGACYHHPLIERGIIVGSVGYVSGFWTLDQESKRQRVHSRCERLENNLKISFVAGVIIGTVPAHTGPWVGSCSCFENRGQGERVRSVAEFDSQTGLSKA